MNKIYTFTLAALMAAASVACDDSCDQLHIDTDLVGIPTVMKGSFPVGTQTVALGDSILFAPQLMDTTGVTYAWKVDGTLVSTDSAYTFRVTKPCRAKLTCTMENIRGKVILESDVFSRHDLTKGLVIVKNGALDFYEPSTGGYYSDIFSSLNFGKGMGMDKYDKLQASRINGKLYVMIATSTSNIDHLYALDAATLYRETSLSVGANLTSLIPLDQRHALLTGGGMVRIDLSTMQKTTLFSEYAWSAYNTMPFNKKLLVNTTYGDLEQVGYFDLNDLLVAREGNRPVMKQLDILQNGKFNLVAAGDACAYTIGYNETAGTHYLAQIAADFSVTKIPLPFTPAKPRYGSNNTLGMAASATGDAIFIIAADNTVYRYAIGDVASLGRPFIASVPEEHEISSGIQLDPVSGTIYLLYQQEISYNKYAGKVIAYDPSGKAGQSIDCGDGIPQAILFNN